MDWVDSELERLLQHLRGAAMKPDRHSMADGGCMPRVYARRRPASGLDRESPMCSIGG
jgi:hypothetical protein